MDHRDNTDNDQSGIIDNDMQSNSNCTSSARARAKAIVGIMNDKSREINSALTGTMQDFDEFARDTVRPPDNRYMIDEVDEQDEDMLDAQTVEGGRR